MASIYQARGGQLWFIRGLMRNQTFRYRHFISRSRHLWIYLVTENRYLHPGALVTLDYFLAIYKVLEVISIYIKTHLRLFEYFSYSLQIFMVILKQIKTFISQSLFLSFIDISVNFETNLALFESTNCSRHFQTYFGTNLDSNLKIAVATVVSRLQPAGRLLPRSELE